MSFNPVSFEPVFALVHAASYPDEPLAEDGQPSTDPAETLLRADIQAARVDLYCDHNDRAVADIRAARKHLAQSHTTHRVDVLNALNRAAWLARHDAYEQAEQALEQAMNHLEPRPSH